MDNLIDRDDIIKVAKKYDFKIDEENSEDGKLVVLRLPFTSEVEVENFRKELSKSTSTEWTLYNNNSKRIKCYHKVWICHLSGYKKATSSKRNAQCNAKLDIKIKNMSSDSVAKDTFLAMDPPLRTVVSVSLEHTHTVHSAVALNLLRVSDEVKHKFFAYFEDGITPGEAISLHEDDLLSLQKYEDLADSSKNPTRRQIYYLHDCWRENNFGGSCKNPLEKLKEKIASYEKEGTTVRIAEGVTWAIVVATKVMKRTQKLASAKEIIFIDSSSSCENTSATVTVMLTASKAGALPLAVLIHKSQTAENYVEAFKLLKDNFKDCFGGQNNPIFMTDDSAAEKNALTDIWPKSRQLLCHFHVAQAEWRWLFAQNCIPADERPRLMKLFQAVMYADSEATLKYAAKLICMETKYPEFVARFKAFFRRRLEWVSFYRQHLITRGNNTNNYAEATVRILKDIVLCRTKAYNVVALVQYIAKTWEQYLTKKLLHFANSRISRPYLLYSSLCSRLENYKIENVIEVESGVFLVQSLKDNVSYVVDSNIGSCFCYSGKSGALCKHQCFLMEHQKIALPNALPINSKERLALGQLALGDQCPQIQFFEELQPSDPLSMSLEDENNMEISSPFEEWECTKATQSSKDGTFEEKENLIEEFGRVTNLAKQNLSTEVAAHLMQTLKKIKTPEDFMKLSFFQSIYKSKKIKVQPTSISRRRKGLTRKNTRVPAGRPPKLRDSKKSKRKRSLKTNIMLNVPNAR